MIQQRPASAKTSQTTASLRPTVTFTASTFQGCTWNLSPPRSLLGSRRQSSSRHDVRNLHPSFVMLFTQCIPYEKSWNHDHQISLFSELQRRNYPRQRQPFQKHWNRNGHQVLCTSKLQCESCSLQRYYGCFVWNAVAIEFDVMSESRIRIEYGDYLAMTTEWEKS